MKCRAYRGAKQLPAVVIAERVAMFVCHVAGETSDLRYFMRAAEHASIFTVDDVTGVLRLASPLDRELESSYSLAVEAHDRPHGGSDVHSGTALVSQTVKWFSVLLI